MLIQYCNIQGWLLYPPEIMNIIMRISRLTTMLRQNLLPTLRSDTNFLLDLAAGQVIRVLLAHRELHRELAQQAHLVLQAQRVLQAHLELRRELAQRAQLVLQVLLALLAQRAQLVLQVLLALLEPQALLVLLVRLVLQARPVLLVLRVPQELRALLAL
jgi:hypothetical protein